MLLARPDRFLRWDVLEEHLDEAAWLGTQREAALDSARFTLEELQSGLERRLRLHLAALHAGGSRVAERLLLPALAGDDAERVFVSALALSYSGQEHAERLLQVFVEGEPPSREAVQRALQLGGTERLTEDLRRLLTTGSAPAVLSAVLDVFRFLQVDPGAPLAALLAHESPEVQVAALRVARLEPGRVGAEVVRRALASSIPTVREAGLELGLVCGMRAAWKACQQAAEEVGPSGCKARLLLALGGEAADIARLGKLLERPALRRDLLWALGFSGRVAAAEACLEWLRDEQVAHVAAEAFGAITGLPLEGGFVREAEALPPPDEDLDEPLRPGIDDELPQPEFDAVLRWWSEVGRKFNPSARYLGGRLFGLEVLGKALMEAPSRRRPPLALELAIRSRGRHQLEVRAFARAQVPRIRAASLDASRGLSLGAFASWMGA
jgi:uncharacterized protein (TIGR02270 family)